MKKRKQSRSTNKIILVLLVLLILVILLYNPISIRVMTVGVAIWHGLDPVIFYRLIRTESSFRSFAVSDAQAIGLGQIRESTAFYIHKEHKRGLLFVPLYNLHLAAKYLKYLLKRYHGNWSLALAAYNWGETNVSSRMQRTRIDPQKDYRDRFRDIPETYHYIDKILNSKNKA